MRPASKNHVFRLVYTEDDTWGWIHEHAIVFPAALFPKRKHASKRSRSAGQVENTCHNMHQSVCQFCIELLPQFQWVGRQVRRQFDSGEILGTIVSYLPRDRHQPALWHVVHTDGDEEDLNETEVSRRSDK